MSVLLIELFREPINTMPKKTHLRVKEADGFGRYWVESESGITPYLVDLTERVDSEGRSHGECRCTYFHTTANPNLAISGHAGRLRRDRPDQEGIRAIHKYQTSKPAVMRTATKTRFWWQRYPITKERREWTPLRVKAAERAVKREAENMPLFPELRRFHTVEERMEKMDARTDIIMQRLRASRAKMWREARAFLRSLSQDDRERLLAKWNTGFMPGGPADLFAVARMLGIDSTSITDPPANCHHHSEP